MVTFQYLPIAQFLKYVSDKGKNGLFENATN